MVAIWRLSAFQLNLPMAEFKRPTNEAEFEANFEQLKPVMTQTQAHIESSRCLFCYDAPCIKACPTGIDIPLFIRQINADNVDGAAKTIYDSNWLGNACGKVCPTEVLCEGSCVYTNEDAPAIEIGRLQTFATTNAINEQTKLYKMAPDNGKKVAIIGAGPAGVAAACELRMLGYSVEIFEAKKQPSGLTVHGVAPYKITNQEALMEMDYLQKQFGYTVHFEKPIQSAQEIKALEEGFHAIFIGVGNANTRSLGLPGEGLTNCVGATEFIEELRKEHAKVSVPNNVVVIGGGNTAMDAASESARMGATNVTLVYRGSIDGKGAYEFEYDLAKAVGVKGVFNAQPKAVLGNGKVASVRFANDDGSEFELPCDMVILATGQEKHRNLFSLIDGLELDEKGRVKANELSFQTSNPKYFAGGDAVNGGAEVVNAAFEGKRAAQGIHKWLGT